VGADDLASARALDEGLAADLRTVGIHDLRELRAVGAAEAWERLLAADLRDALGVRLRLEAAVCGRPVHLLDPGVRERCAEHVRRRLAPEPGGAVAAGAGRRVSPPAGRDPHAARDRRRLVVAAWAFALPVIAFLVAKLLA
jgi:hypothetical protein